MRSSRYDPIKVERKLLQAAATGHLARVLRVLEKNGKYFVKKRRKPGRKRSVDDGERRRDRRKRRRDSSDSESGSESDGPSMSGNFSYSYESEEEFNGKAKRKMYSYSSRKSRQSDELREALARIDINCADAEGLTPLHHACYAGSTELVEFLVAECADVTAQDARGNSPLHIAARYGFTDVIARLRDAGGDMHAANYEGVTPLIAVEARIERLRKEKEERLKPKRSYMEVQDWGTRLAEELSDDESWWGHSWGEPQPKKDWYREDWSEFLYKEEDDDDLCLGTSRKRRSKDPLEGGLFKELSDQRKREQEERNREAKRILEEEIAKDRAWRERVLQKKSVDRHKQYEISWKKFSESCNLCLSYSDVPFPVEKGKEADLARVILHDSPPSEHKQLLRKEILRWHPDKFLQKYRSRLQGPDHDRILARVNELSQALHQLYSSSV
jgi:NF-kappa-B inhibitor-like protein 1